MKLGRSCRGRVCFSTGHAPTAGLSALGTCPPKSYVSFMSGHRGLALLSGQRGQRLSRSPRLTLAAPTESVHRADRGPLERGRRQLSERRTNLMGGI